MQSKLILSLLQKYWKQIAIIVLLAVVFFSIKGCNEKNQRIKDLEAAAKFSDSLYSSKIKNWKDKNGELHQQVTNLLTDRVALLNELDSVGKLLKVKPKQVSSLSKTSLQVQVDAKPTVDSTMKKVAIEEGTDSLEIVEKLDFNWYSKDSATHIWGTVGDGPDSVHLKAYDTLSRTDYWKRKWLLGAKTYYSDFHNTNDNITVIGYKGVQFRQREKKWSIGLSILYGYPINVKDLEQIQLKKPAIAAGVSLQYSLFKF